jgi:hypothetical protein
MPETPPNLPHYRSTETAPFIFFDNAPAYGVLGGVIEVELTARTLLPNFSGAGVGTEIVPAARLRCSASAAAQLIDTLAKAIDMLKQLQSSTGTRAAAASDKVN